MWSDAFHHLLLRKRIHLEKQPFPHPRLLVRVMDVLIYCAGIAGPLVSLPQVYEIWVNHNAESISVFTWAGYTGLTILWLIYGIVHKQKPIIFAQIVWFFFNAFIT